MKWKKTEIGIAASAIFKHHRIPMKGYVLEGKGIGIHRDLRSRKVWRITHLKSGYGFGWPAFKLLSTAKKFAEKIALIEIDGQEVNWNLSISTLYRKHTKIQLKGLVEEAWGLEEKK